MLASAAASGWTFADVQAELRAGSWPGLWSFYARYAPRHRAERLAADWLNAVAHASHPPSPPPAGAATPGHAQNPDTRTLPTQRGAPSPLVSSRSATASGSAAEHGHLRSWQQAVELVEGGRYPGRGGHALGLALRAVGNAPFARHHPTGLVRPDPPAHRHPRLRPPASAPLVAPRLCPARAAEALDWRMPCAGREG